MTQHYQVIDYASREDWLAGRRESIGASESAAILGESPYNSALSVWADKTNPPLVAEASSERQQFGLDAEPLVLAAYQRKYGGRVERWPVASLARSIAEPHLHATPDAIAFDDEHEGPGVCQIKTSSEYAQGDWRDGPPLWVLIQVQHEMFVTGCRWAVVPVLFGLSRLDRVFVERNDTFIDAMLPVLRDFWTCVELRVAPAVDGSAATSRALARLHPDDSGEAIALADSADATIERWLRLKSLAKRIEEAQAACENELKAAIGDATYGATPGGQWVSWKTTKRAGYTAAPTQYRTLRACKPPKAIEAVTPARGVLTNGNS